MRAFRRCSVVLMAGLALGSPACGDDDIAPGAAAELESAYRLVVEAVEAEDRTAARQALRSLTESAESWGASGGIDPVRAEGIRAAAEQVLIDLRLLPDPTETSPSPTDSPVPTVEPDEGGDSDSGSDPQGKAKGHDEGNDEGKGEGHGGDDDE